MAVLRVFNHQMACLHPAVSWRRAWPGLSVMASSVLAWSVLASSVLAWSVLVSPVLAWSVLPPPVLACPSVVHQGSFKQSDFPSSPCRRPALLALHILPSVPQRERERGRRWQLDLDCPAWVQRSTGETSTCMTSVICLRGLYL